MLQGYSIIIIYLKLHLTGSDMWKYEGSILKINGI